MKCERSYLSLFDIVKIETFVHGNSLKSKNGANSCFRFEFQKTLQQILAVVWQLISFLRQDD